MSSSNAKPLSHGVIAGIVISGTAAILLFCGLLLYFFVWKPRQDKRLLDEMELLKQEFNFEGVVALIDMKKIKLKKKVGQGAFGEVFHGFFF